MLADVRQQFIQDDRDRQQLLERQVDRRGSDLDLQVAHHRFDVARNGA